MAIGADEFELELGRGWRQRCIDYGKSKPPLLDDCFIFSRVERTPKRKLKNWCAWYTQKAESGHAGRHVTEEGVPLKVIFPELKERL